MLRFLVGLTLFLLIVTMPPRALAGGESVVDSGRSLPDLKQQLEELLHLWHPTDSERRQWEEERERLLRMVTERDRVYEKMQSLAEVGPTFVFEAVDGLHPLERVRAACLVGETGKIYMYDLDGAQAPSVVDEHEFSKAVGLAKSLEHVEWRPVLARKVEDAHDIRQFEWHVLLNGRSISLQITGDYVGAHPNPQAAELVKLIDGWCPYAPKIRSRQTSEERAYKGTLECERMTDGVGVFRVPVSSVPVSISVGSFRGTPTVLAVFDSDGLNDRLPEFATGTVGPDGGFRLISFTWDGGDYTIRGDYSGTLSATGGTLSGTRVLRRETTGDGETRTCKSTVLRVELSKQ